MYIHPSLKKTWQSRNRRQKNPPSDLIFSPGDQRRVDDVVQLLGDALADHRVPLDISVIALVKLTAVYVAWFFSDSLKLWPKIASALRAYILSYRMEETDGPKQSSRPNSKAVRPRRRGTKSK